MSSSENQPENTTEQPQNDSFKAQLDRVAFDRRNTPQESQGNPVVEKSKDPVQSLHELRLNNLSHRIHPSRC